MFSAIGLSGSSSLCRARRPSGRCENHWYPCRIAWPLVNAAAGIRHLRGFSRRITGLLIRPPNRATERRGDHVLLLLAQRWRFFDPTLHCRFAFGRQVGGHRSWPRQQRVEILLPDVPAPRELDGGDLPALAHVADGVGLQPELGRHFFGVQRLRPLINDAGQRHPPQGSPLPHGALPVHHSPD